MASLRKLLSFSPQRFGGEDECLSIRLECQGEKCYKTVIGTARHRQERSRVPQSGGEGVEVKHEVTGVRQRGGNKQRAGPAGETAPCGRCRSRRPAGRSWRVPGRHRSCVAIAKSKGTKQRREHTIRTAREAGSRRARGAFWRRRSTQSEKCFRRVD